MPEATPTLEISPFIALPREWRKAWETVILSESSHITQEGAIARWDNLNRLSGQARSSLRRHVVMTAFNGVISPLILTASGWLVGVPMVPMIGLVLGNISGGLLLWIYWRRLMSPVPPESAPPGTTRESREVALILAGVRLQGFVLRDWLMQRAVLVTAGGLLLATVLVALMATRS